MLILDNNRTLYFSMEHKCLDCVVGHIEVYGHGEAYSGPRGMVVSSLFSVCPPQGMVLAYELWRWALAGH